MALFTRQPAPPEQPVLERWETPPDAVDVTGCDFMAVVGESYRRDRLEQLMDGGADHPRERRFWAQLIPEPTNPHDENAVKVHVEGWHVGYLARDVAEEFCEPISGWGSAICPAIVRGRDSEVGYGVVLRVDYGILRGQKEPPSR